MKSIFDFRTLSPLPFCVTAKHKAVQNLPKFKEIPYLCPVNQIVLDKNFQAMQTIKIFLGSSITELHDERVTLGDYLMNSVRPIFKQDGIEVEVCKCEDIRSGNTGEKPQDRIDNLLRKCDVSVFMFKTRAGNATIHEFDVARELQKSRRHEIYVFCFDEPEEKKEESLKDFQKRLEKEEFYWYTCKDVTDLESQFVLGLLKYERQLLGLTKPLAVEQESKTEQNGDARFAKYQQNEQAQAQLREEIHKDIDDLLQQTKTVMANEDETIAARIFKVIELHKKADQWAAATDYDKKKYSDLLLDYARFLSKYGLYKDAQTVYLHQIDLSEELFGTEHPNTAASYNNIGTVYRRQADYDKALEYHQKALAIREKVLGMEHPDTAASYNNIGVVYVSQGDYDKALEFYQKALAIREKVLGMEHPDTAESYNNIGRVYKEQGNYDKALEYLFKALTIQEKILNTHPATAASYNNIGEVYNNKGDYGKALEYHFRALAIREKALGTEHPYTAGSYDNIGAVYYSLGDYDKALDYHFKALKVMEKTLGAEHPDTAKSYNNIGMVYYRQGDYDTALKHYQKALAINVKVFGTSHPDTAQSYNSIGSVFYSQGDYSKALEYDVKALAIMEKVLGTDHPYTAQSYSNIGLVYKEQGDYDKALDFLNRAYLIYVRTLGQNHPSTKNVYEWIEMTNSVIRGKMQKLPVGLQSFESLRREKYTYVDKTKLVFDLVNDAKYVFLSRPRRFGKSLFISTLRAYFEGKKELFEGLTISELEKKWESFPVLYLDLNVGMYDSVKGLVETLNSNLNDWEEEFGIKSNSTDVAHRFRSIIKKVAKKENRNVVILVDEYDKPLLQTIDDESLQQDFRNILKAFFSNLKTCDEFIRFAMLTGVSKFSKISLFSDLNNLTDISLNQRYAKICGLTADEIYQTFSVHLDSFVKQEKIDKTTLLNKMRQMYGGYHFTEKTSIDLYNPFSVLNALSEKNFRNYWFSTGTPTFLIKLLQNGDYNLQDFSEGKIKANNLAAKECLSEEPIALFYQTGYLTIKEYSKEFDNYSLGFPNREVEQGFLSFLFPRYTGKTDARSTTFLESILIDLHEGHIKDFLERMKIYFADTPYELIRDMENYYQNVMFTICRLTGYSTKAEYHTSYGRIDMVVKTEQYIYVFEFKFNKTAKEALEQIDTKEYLLPFRSDGRKLCKIGVNFSGRTNNIDDYDFCWE